MRFHILLPVLAGLAAMQPLAVAAQTQSIVAVLNGDVVTANDVENRARLFALSAGMPDNAEILSRLRPQITRQLIDEKLRMQEIQERKIVVGDQEIADAIKEIEQRNGLQPGGLRAKLQSQGVAYRTLVDQIRVQIGWTRVLRQELADKAQVTDAEVDEEMKHLATQTGQPEYRVSQIFIAVDNPDNVADAKRFADTVITQLRAGAAFPIIAAQFSQAQNALQGGDEGWLHADQLDPAVARIVAKMPAGAISNPVEVPGGIAIIALRARREVGRDMATVLSIRQVFLPFAQPLNPQAPTDQQKHQLDQAQKLMHSVHDCAGMEAAAKDVNSPRNANPGDVRLEQLNPPAFRDMLAKLALNEVSKPLIAPDGIGLVMVCSKTTKNVAEPTKADVRERLLGQRIDLASRQLMRDLQRRANVSRR